MSLGNESARKTGSLLILHLPSSTASTASWVETRLSLFHTSLTILDPILDSGSYEPNSVYFDPPKPTGPILDRCQKRDFVFATTTVELAMVGSNNPARVQSILDDVANASSVMFKMSYTLPTAPSTFKKGVLFLRASGRSDRDSWISGITEAMFMAENVSQSFADFRKMRVASVMTRERRGTSTFSQDTHGSIGSMGSLASHTTLGSTNSKESEYRRRCDRH